MKNWMKIIGIALTSATMVSMVLADRTIPSEMTEATAECIECHKDDNVSLYQQWGKSKHYGANVGCYECHMANESDVDAFEHEGYTISVIVSPNDCARCHKTEVEEFANSHHSKAGRIMGSLDNVLAEVVEGNRGLVTPGFPHGNSAAAVNGCWQCHGSAVKVLDDGSLDPATWPNTGIGRVNPDGSEGSCSACHQRHEFSVAQARNPENCGKCHMGPDHPQLEVYNESKHGINFRANIDDMNLVTTAGVATRLAEYFYEKDYNICGVKYDSISNTTKHDIADSLDDILEYRGSKYIPSNTKIALEKILKEKKKSIVFGLPCQIYGLRKVIEKKKIADKFILIDFFCAGMLSKNLWDKYLDYLRRKFSISKIKQINFKDKTEGWRKSSLYVIDECGNKYRQNRFNDIFYAFLLRRVPYQEACYSCAFRRHVVSSDIRLGDFWGPKYKAWDDGVELMTLMNDKGRYAWNEIKDYFSYQICKEKDLYESQDSGAMNMHVKKPKNYEQVLTALSSEQNIEEIFRDLQIAKIPIGN